MMRWLSTRTYVSIGLCGVTASVLLVLAFFGFIPDRISAVREGRAALAEVTAAASTALIASQDMRGLDAALQLMIDRNADLRSVGIRREDGRLILSAGDHAAWQTGAGDHSTEDQVKVPILAGSNRWGQAELRFQPLATGGVLGVVHHPWVKLVGALMLLGFAAFHLYLGRVLKQLDPSQAVPARVRAALDALAEGLIVIDRRQHVVLANGAFAAVIGKSSEALLGRQVSEFAWMADDAQPFDRKHSPWAQVLADGQARTNVMVRLTAADGHPRSFIVNCAPVLGSGSRPGGVLISLDDVTQMEETRAALAVAKDDAETANRAKSEFLANMSHEIRTPMNAILGFTELLRRGQGRSEVDLRKHLGTIHSSGKHLLDLINDILDLSKVEAGRFEMERVRCSPHQTVREVLQILEAKAREKAITLEFEVAGAIPEAIESDPGRLRQIVTNLVGNAIKFTERGTVKVALKLIDGKEPVLQIAIRDSGIGIAQDKLEAIFDPFTQADSSVSRRFGGTGLGLAISRRFARALGGDIVASSQPGHGSTFTVTIATGSLADIRMITADQAIAPREAANDAPAAGHWSFPHRRVLVVDDGPENRELVRLVLSELGLEIEEAENGRIGVDKTLAGAFDLVLMDIQMPELDGLSATRELRARGCTLPIVALTAHAMKGYEQEIREAGCSDWLVKPIDIDRLIGLLASMLGGKRAEGVDTTAMIDALPVEVETAVARLPIFSRFADKPRLHAAVRLFAQRLGGQLAAMDTAFSDSRYDNLARLAHALKGGGGTVGFDQFTEPAVKLEQAAKAADREAIRSALDTIHDIADRIVIPGESAGTARAAA